MLATAVEGSGCLSWMDVCDGETEEEQGLVIGLVVVRDPRSWAFEERPMGIGGVALAAIAHRPPGRRNLWPRPELSKHNRASGFCCWRLQSHAASKSGHEAGGKKPVPLELKVRRGKKTTR